MKKTDLSGLVVTTIRNVCGYTVPEGTEGMQKRDCCALVIKHSGRTTYNVGGRTLTADPNNIVFLAKGDEYSIEVEKKGACVVIEFDISDETQVITSGEYFFNNARDIFATAKNILHYWGLKGPAFGAKCLSELYSIITQISTLDAYANTLAGKYGIIHKSVKFIETNYAKSELYTPELAQMSGIGETYYRNIFISVFGMPPAKYIQQYRIEKSKELLVSTDLTIDEIAVSVGIANASYFCKVFKNFCGMTPLEFAEKARLLG